MTRETTSTLEFPYSRTLGPVVGAFFAGLREQRLLGAPTSSGRVLFPPLEYDPETGEALAAELVEVGPARHRAVVDLGVGTDGEASARPAVRVRVDHSRRRGHGDGARGRRRLGRCHVDGYARYGRAGAPNRATGSTISNVWEPAP